MRELLIKWNWHNLWLYMCLLHKCGQVFYIFRATTAIRGHNWYITDPATVPQHRKAQNWNIKIKKILKKGYIALASWGDDKFSQAGDSLPHIKTDCPKLKSPRLLVPALRLHVKLLADITVSSGYSFICLSQFTGSEFALQQRPHSWHIKSICVW